MPLGAFRVFQDPQNSRDIQFAIAVAPGGAIPEDQLALRDEVERTLIVLRGIFPEESPRFREYFRPLLSLAQAGLVGDTASPELSRRALIQLREQVVTEEGGRIKNQYMRRLGVAAFLLALAALIIKAIALRSRSLAPVVPYLTLWIGCMAGVWLSFGARKVEIGFNDLHILEKDRLEPRVRLAFAGLLTVALGLLLATGAISLSLGSLQAIHFLVSESVALLIGLICGFSEHALATSLSGNAGQILRLKSGA